MSKFVAVAKKTYDRCATQVLVVKDFLTRREEGASLVEYALLVALIALVAITGVALVGNKLVNAFNNIGNKL